jgi:2-polyprenyl-3-methyl-5-hydroxy-6-metoxy-1,4-benzoquinol methylase
MSWTRGQKRAERDPLDLVQAASKEWWERSPMTYDWRGESQVQVFAPEWFDDQDRRSAAAQRHFATDRTPFDRLIPYASLAGQEVLEIGVGSGFHAELMARAGAVVTGIDLTQAAVERTTRRFELRNLTGRFEQWDAEQARPEFESRFAFVWSWGVIHHSSRTARIVRNVARWLKSDGSFSGMVYHRSSTSVGKTLLFDGIARGRIVRKSADELLWRRSDGFTARFYPADQWRDLLLGFFDVASVSVTGTEADVLPLPRALRRLIVPRISSETQARILRRFGSFLVFDARKPLDSVST